MTVVRFHLLFTPIDACLIPDLTLTPPWPCLSCLSNQISSPDLVLPRAEHLERLVSPMRGKENSSW